MSIRSFWFLQKNPHTGDIHRAIAEIHDLAGPVTGGADFHHLVRVTVTRVVHHEEDPSLSIIYTLSESTDSCSPSGGGEESASILVVGMGVKQPDAFLGSL